MSYIKSAVVKDFTIYSRDGEAYSVGGEITTLLSLDYGESIFEPSITVVATFAATEKVLSAMRARGTERVSLSISHPSGTLKFDDLRIRGMNEVNTTSTATVFRVLFTHADAFLNEQNRLATRFDNTTKISSHVNTILFTNLKTTLRPNHIFIEDTANAEGFFGNHWTPYRAIYWLCKRSLSTVGSTDGTGTDRAGFLFWMTKCGYMFKSIDALAQRSKEESVPEFTQNEVVDETDTISNFNVYNPRFERDQDIIEQMQKGLYNDDARYYNIHSIANGIDPVGKPIGQSLTWEEVAKKQTHFGNGEIDKLDFDINVNGGFDTVLPFVDGTMKRDGSIEIGVGGNGEFNPHRIVTQSRMKYLSMKAISLRVTIPYNLDIRLEAGSPVKVNLLASNNGIDKDRSGMYLVKDLRHSWEPDQAFTHLRLIRDTYGMGKKQSTNLLSS